MDLMDIQENEDKVIGAPNVVDETVKSEFDQTNSVNFVAAKQVPELKIQEILKPSINTEPAS